MPEFDIDDLPGYLVEGTLKRHKGQWYIDGPEEIPLKPVLERYEGEEVRFTLAGIAELADFAETYGEQNGQDGEDTGA